MPKSFSVWLILIATNVPALGQAPNASDTIRPVGLGAPSAVSPAATPPAPPLAKGGLGGVAPAPPQLPPPPFVATLPPPTALAPGANLPAPPVAPLPPPPTLATGTKSPAANSPPSWPVATEEITEHTTLPRPAALENTCCVAPRNPWMDNFSFFAGLDGTKEPADLGLNANFGYRLAANWGLPLAEAAGIGIQLGVGFNYERSAVRVLHFIDGTVEHTQVFATAGVFRRSESGLNWGIAYDYRFDDYYDRLDTAQWRAQIGVPMGPNDEVGVWGTLRDRSTTAALVSIPFTVRPLNQINFYWRHVWPGAAATRFWVGFTEDHGRFSLFFPGEANVRHPVCFGTDLLIPLNDSLAIFGEAQFITPNDSGTVSATLGIAWYPGAARLAARNRFSPYLNVAGNSTMPLDLRR